MNQQCKVCGEPAAGFHFGAFTCEGCKVSTTCARLTYATHVHVLLLLLYRYTYVRRPLGPRVLVMANNNSIINDDDSYARSVYYCIIFIYIYI